MIASWVSLVTLLAFGTGVGYVIRAALRYYRAKQSTMESALDLTRSEINIKEAVALQEITKHNSTIENVIENRTVGAKGRAISQLKDVNSALKSVNLSLGIIEEQLAERTVTLEPAVQAGIMRVNSKGKYDIVNLPGLSENEKKLVEISVSRHNRYLGSVNGQRKKAEAAKNRLRNKKSNLENIIKSDPEKILRELGVPPNPLLEKKTEIIKESKKDDSTESKVKSNPAKRGILKRRSKEIKKINVNGDSPANPLQHRAEGSLQTLDTGSSLSSTVQAQAKRLDRGPQTKRNRR